MTTRKRINFEQLADELQKDKIGKDDVTIRSGKCAETDAIALLAAWRGVADLPYGLWEELSAVHIDRDALPASPWSLLRARLFGNGGDLDMWRVDSGFAWRFVGPPSAKIPLQLHAGANFWEQEGNKATVFFRSETTYLLWGKNQGNGAWQEDRVAAATLRYPVKSAGATAERVQVRTVLYSRSGLVEFVWHQGLEEYDG